jgi:NADH:ubiquinone oxidoreductase subunit C
VSGVSEADLSDKVKAAYPNLVESSEVLRERRVSVTVKRDGFLEVAKSLRDDFGFIHPVCGGAVDYPKESRMQMIYYLLHPGLKVILTYRINLPRDDLMLPTLTQVWEAMSFHERETHDMFGIEFEGHPNMIPLLIPPDWRGGYPLRKDFKGEGVE